ncbi:MAG: hypothetical protein U1F18_02780 [Steroidobacteraceae bacterium]
MNKLTLSAALALLTALAACAGKKDEPAETAAPASAAATGEPASAPAPASSESAPATPAAAAPAAEEDEATIEKRKAVEYALNEEKIATDPKGQWASTAKATSTYGDAKDPQDYSASKATGAPDVANFSDNGNAWTAKEADGGIERLEVGFARPVHASEIRIRQSFAPGAIIKVELIDTTGAGHVVYEGVDAATYDKYNFWFRKSFDKTTYQVAGAKITLATNAVPSWNEIDAVQLIGE